MRALEKASKEQYPHLFVVYPVLLFGLVDYRATHLIELALGAKISFQILPPGAPLAFIEDVLFADIR